MCNFCEDLLRMKISRSSVRQLRLKAASVNLTKKNKYINELQPPGRSIARIKNK